MGKDLSKQILMGILVGGAIFIAASSPYFALNLPKVVARYMKKERSEDDKYPEFNNAFYYLKGEGYLNIIKDKKQIYISLTDKGRKRAGKYMIDDLEIKKPKRWDKKWRVIIFDIPNKTKVKREAFRGKLKELNFYQLQRSVWIHPYDCEIEINLLRDFFGLTSTELRLIIADKIENDDYFQKVFKLKKF